MFIRKNLIKNNLTKDNRGNDNGFTLAELLIVVAIIAVLVAISIPIFTTQLEKSREATDMANVRAAYAEVMDSVLDGNILNPNVRVYNGEYSKVVRLKQRVDGWSTDGVKEIGGVKSTDSAHWFGNPHALGTCKIIYSEANGTILVWDNQVSGGLIAESGKKNFGAASELLNPRSYYTRDVVINGRSISKVRSYYVAPGSYFEQYAINFEANPQPCSVADSEFWQNETHDNQGSNSKNLGAFGYFTIKEDGKTIDKYTIVTEDSIYYSEDGGKTWIEK